MVFSSQLFLYGFLPVFFSLYYLIADRRKNWLILIASLIFYSVGAGSTVFVLLASVWTNQFLAVRIAPASPPRRSVLLVIGVTINLLGLAYYKYTSFLWQLVADGFAAVELPQLPAAPQIPLPVGISFLPSRRFRISSTSTGVKSRPRARTVSASGSAKIGHCGQSGSRCRLDLRVTGR